MMNVYEFLQKLGIFYPSNESDNAFKERINEYANNILIKIRQTKNQYNYDKVFNHILQTYKFKTFPSLPDILEALPYGVVIIENYSGQEGEVIKQKFGNFEYVFTVVPNHWENVKTISEVRQDIMRKVKND